MEKLCRICNSKPAAFGICDCGADFDGRCLYCEYNEEGQKHREAEQQRRTQNIKERLAELGK